VVEMKLVYLGHAGGDADGFEIRVPESRGICTCDSGRNGIGFVRFSSRIL